MWVSGSFSIVLCVVLLVLPRLVDSCNVHKIGFLLGRGWGTCLSHAKFSLTHRRAIVTRNFKYSGEDWWFPAWVVIFHVAS